MGFRNTGTQKHWLLIELVGAAVKRQGIEAQVLVTMPEGMEMKEVGATDGAFFSQGHYRLYFGLGSHEIASSVAIRWSDGYRQELTNVIGDRLLCI